MCAYKLTYYNAKGLGEPIRLLLAYGNIEYEDIRVPFQFTGSPPVLPQDIKDRCPWGQVPILEFEGKCLAQSLAITRYLARKFNLVGADDFEAAKCDEYTDTIKEFNKDFFPLYMENDPVKRTELKKSIGQQLSSKYFSKFESIVAANGGNRLVGKSLTWADMYFAFFVNHVSNKFQWDLLQEFPNLKGLVEKVFQVPQFKEWVEKRPETEF